MYLHRPLQDETTVGLHTHPRSTAALQTGGANCSLNQAGGARLQPRVDRVQGRLKQVRRHRGRPWSAVAQERRSHTFEKDNLVIAGTLIHGVHTVQVQRQAPPKAMHLSWLQGHQVPIPGQPPEVLAWVTEGKVAAGAWRGYGDLSFHSTGPPRVGYL